MNTKTPRSAGQWAATIIFGLLSVAFLFRFAQFGISWARGVVEGDANFKALTIWALVYVVVCAGIASVAWFMPRGDETDSDQKAERGT